MGPHCANESDMYKVSEFQSTTREFAALGNFNGGDSNRYNLRQTKLEYKSVLRCLPNFLIRYNNYDKAVYKTFVEDIGTFIYHEVWNESCEMHSTQTMRIVYQ